KRHCVDIWQESAECGRVLVPTRRDFDTVEQFCFGHDRHADVGDGHGLQTLDYKGVRALHDVGAGIRVQHEARHQRSRSWMGRSSTSFMKVSDATCALSK